MSTFPQWLFKPLNQSEGEVQRVLRDDTALHFLMTWSLFKSKYFSGFMKTR